MTTIPEIYDLISDFRQNPSDYDPHCGYGNLRLPPYDVVDNLQMAAAWQASHLCTPLSHETCKEYCHLFNNSCRHTDRIKSFLLPRESYNEHELLVMGPHKPFQTLIQSQPHCQLLLANNLNSMGGAIMGNIFILVLAWIKK